MTLPAPADRGGPECSLALRTDSYRGAASEDRAAIFRAADGSPILLVADGVGGRAGGGEAASLLQEMVRETAPQIKRQDAAAWARFLMQADSLVRDDPDAGETTAVVAQVAPGGRRIVGASVGDSEAWFLTSDGLFDLTEMQRKKPFLGSGGARVVPFSLTVPAAGGTLLVASDGLFKYADYERIAEAALLPDLDAAADSLIHAARLRSGSFSDDIALLLCRIAPGGRKPGLWRRILSAKPAAALSL